MTICLEYHNNQYLEFELYDVNYFCGPNEKVKWEILRSFKRLALEKALKLDEYPTYGEDGITFIQDGSNVTHIKWLFLTNETDIKNEFKLKKNTLFYQQLLKYQTHSVLNQYIDSINDYLFQIEYLLEQEQVCQRITYQFEPFKYTQLLTNLNIQYGQENLELLDVNQLFDDYLKLIEDMVMTQSDDVWLVARHLRHLLTKENEQKLIDFSKQMANKMKKFHLIYICDEPLLEVNPDDIAKIMYVGMINQQLPEADIFVNRVELNYPIDVTFELNELLQRMNQLLPYVHEQYDKKYIFDKENMVLLKVLEVLLS